MNNSIVESITWIYCPGHAGVRGNERTDLLVGNAAIDGTLLRRDKADLMKAVINSFQDEDDVNEAENVHI